jgi:hypothetical protein
LLGSAVRGALSLARGGGATGPSGVSNY